MKILNFGSLNIDYVYQVDHFVSGGETLLSEGMEVFPGGKGLNQSIALARAGAQVYHAGAVGESDGGFLTEILKNNGVDITHIGSVKGDTTGHAIIQVDKSGQNCILLYGGANQRISQERIDGTLKNFEKGDMLLIQNEISNLDYLIGKAHELGLRIVLNPSPINKKLLESDMSKIDMFIMNEIEAAAILGVEELSYSTPEIEKLIPKTFLNKDIIITFGSEGSVFIDEEEVLHQTAFKVDAIDTTAAGDTFTGYFLAQILKGKTSRDSLNIAAKAGAIACTRKGAEPSIPYLEEIDTLIL